MILTLASWAAALQAHADTYAVDESFSFGDTNVTLTGTLDIPEGSYVLMGDYSHPFTSINLTLTMDGSSYDLDHSVDEIQGSGEFLIDATATTLTFNTADANGVNSADLLFEDEYDYNEYGIGSDADPAFEAAYTETESDIQSAIAPVTFPVVFGTAVPEPAHIGGTLLLLGFSAQYVRCRFRGKQE
jgi:hypothetical protein